MESNQLGNSAGVSGSISIRTRRDIPANSPHDNTIYELLQQASARLRQVGVMLERYQRTLASHVSRLTDIRRRAFLASEDRQTAGECLQQARHRVAEVGRMQADVIALTARRWALLQRVEWGNQSATDADLLDLDHDVGIVEIFLLRLNEDSLLSYQSAFFAHLAATNHRAGGASAQVPDHSGAACAAVDGAGLVAGRGQDMPAFVSRSRVSDRLALVLREAQSLGGRLAHYRDALGANLTALIGLRDQTGPLRGGRSTLARLIQQTQDEINLYPRALAHVNNFVARVRATSRRQSQGGAAVSNQEIARLEASTVRLVVEIGARMVGTPLMNNIDFLAREYGVDGGADAPDSSGACGGPSGANAALLGRPDAISSYRVGYDASWETQARFFQHGTSVSGNPHRRRYAFGDGSYVDIQAHQPMLTTSDDSNFAVATSFFAGLVSAMVFGGPVFAAVVDHSRPYDAAWQGYTARYFSNAASPQAWGTQQFYGWIRSSSVGSAVTVNGNTDPQRFSDFADSSTGVRWWRWKSGYADARSAAGPEIFPLGERSLPGLCQAVDALVQRMDQMGAGAMAQGATAPPQDSSNTHALVAVAH
jgi:hypothetical protein